MSARDGVFLLEIGMEEIPARMIDGALRDLGRGLLTELESSRLIHAEGSGDPASLRVFATPRRLAVEVIGVLDRQPDAEQEAIGPSIRVAYDAAGKPTRAAEGFARAQGMAVADLKTVSTPKGECIGVRRTVRGRLAREVLAERLPELLGGMTFPKMMRWGSGEFRFVRPVHSILALLDRDEVPVAFAGVRAGRSTFGHRQTGGGPIALDDPRRYADRLREVMVMADPAERRRAIEHGLETQARASGGHLASPPGSPAGVHGDPDLLAEVTHLVEWPLVVAGEIEAAFLNLPEEILVTAMRHHQKFFALRAASGKLLNRFLAVANAAEDRTGAIRRGYEWVLRARLVDARFFHDEDRKTSLHSHAEGLGRVTFHERLGSYAAKIERMTALLDHLLPEFGGPGVRIDGAAAREAVRLCKADLTTQVVKEFPELEGIVGGLYAAADGAPAPVAEAIREHYLPRGAEDPPPSGPLGALVSLVDRFDTQAGIFLLGIVPTGSRDPYALRRSVQGACRILIEKQIHLSLRHALERALSEYATSVAGETMPAEAAATALLDFYRGRLEHLGVTAGLRQDSVRAALGAGADDPRDAWLRMTALDAARSGDDFKALALAHKRIKNILAGQSPEPLRREDMREKAEVALDRAVREAGPALDTSARAHDYAGALTALNRLRGPLETFFEDVLVMAPEAAVRAARLALLKSIADLFLRVGDFSEIVLEGEPVAVKRARPGASRTGKER